MNFGPARSLQQSPQAAMPTRVRRRELKSVQKTIYASDIESPIASLTLNPKQVAVYTSDIDGDEAADQADKGLLDAHSNIDAAVDAALNAAIDADNKRFKMFQEAMNTESVREFASTFPRGYYRRDSVEYGPDSWIQLFKVDKNQTIEQAAQAWVQSS